MFEIHLHPFLSSFPFVLVTLAVVAEGYSLFNRLFVAQRYVFFHLCLAVIMIVSAFVSGYVAAPQAHSILARSEEEISYHHLWGKGVLIVAVLSLMLQWISTRAKYNQLFFVSLFRLSLLTLWLFTMVAGFLGSNMLLSAPVPTAVSE